MPQDSAADQPFPLGDEPIETLAQDGLDWKHYVFALLRRLEAADTPFVLGVFGGWGSGKTSFLNPEMCMVFPELGGRISPRCR